MTSDNKQLEFDFMRTTPKQLKPSESGRLGRTLRYVRDEMPPHRNSRR